jgi:hypothetical protein
VEGYLVICRLVWIKYQVRISQSLKREGSEQGSCSVKNETPLFIILKVELLIERKVWRIF